MQPVTDFVKPIPSGRNLHRPEIIPATREEIVKHYELETLDTLTTDHMSKANKVWFDGLLTRIREWREEASQITGHSFILCSPQIGIGKTHIAKAVKDSFAEVATAEYSEPAFVDGRPNFSFMRRGRMYTGKQLMKEMDKPEYSHDEFFPNGLRCVVLDDIGREGSLQFEKRDEQSQLEEKQHRYFELINYFYERRNSKDGYNGRAKTPVSLFITSNLSIAELSRFFNEATWSRLNELCPKGCIVEAPALPDMRMVRSGRL